LTSDTKILAALLYMGQAKNKIIHYDLKPGNILFDADGHVKITDFGLSKELDPAGDSKMALTSQGAGTYWYLPPECFQTGNGSPPLISQKVDVWSVGVILYQMVYGKKPFGENMSQVGLRGRGSAQETLLRENVILNVTNIEFPAKPAVSAECKDFIVKCLQKDVQRRWSVPELCDHPFINPNKPKSPVCLKTRFVQNHNHHSIIRLSGLLRWELQVCFNF
jgi:PREDICTED: similar to tousled-like kinase